MPFAITQQQQQRALGADAAAAVRQAAGLARRRGHAQVTPLHVACAIIMSSSSSSAPAGAAGLLLRAAFPLQQRQQHEAAALWLRLDAAVGRLPVRAAAAAPRMMMVPLSNALVAALKRAQASAAQEQDRRSGKAVVVELELLVASILDDPNVDRAVREAGAGILRKQKQEGAVSIVELSSSSIDSETSGDNSRQTAAVVDQDGMSLALMLSCHNHSRPDQFSQAKQRTGRSAIVGGTSVVTMVLPPWLRRINQDQYHPNLTRSASQYQPKFRELTGENLKIMCHALEGHVPPRHRDNVPGVAGTILRCRSGMTRRRWCPPNSSATWLLFRGKDRRGKKAVALELTRLVFCTYTEFASSDSDPGLNTMSKGRYARNNGAYAGTRLLEAILENPHRVVFIDGIDDLDHELGAAIKNVIATGRITRCNGTNGGLEDAIIVLCSDGVTSPSLARAKRRRINSNGQQNNEESRHHFSLDLNAPAEDQEYVEEEEEDGEKMADNDAGIIGIVDGVFRFD
ncbi:hypothetical protein BRADI_4g42000v3 [Brachypodium distachyon]|uniref:Clp R domain-containing protein n=2 Tax=Brachypodium distachyon TaxID=15368 RepID=A0A2K2CTR6_BRADI|nr:hypothetical protein BRADI_4g42000v3 [Brachypodium distachyon]PNT65407.1 hypothetical protein BRADI_4g42000v3 [Brachypodium distachyon]